MGIKGIFKQPPIGKKFGNLTIIKSLNSFKNKKLLIECLCDCGKTKVTRIDSVMRGITKSCGCIRRLNIKGQKFGHLTAIKYAGENRTGHSLWVFRCVCKNLVIKNAIQTKAKNTILHCGCKKLSPNEAALNALYAKYRSMSNLRYLTFTLTKKFFKTITSEDCYYCGNKPFALFNGPSFKKPYLYSGIDRVNNKLGYTPQNSVPCCKICNIAKAGYTKDIFIDWSKKLYKNLKKRGFYE